MKNKCNCHCHLSPKHPCISTVCNHLLWCDCGIDNPICNPTKSDCKDDGLETRSLTTNEEAMAIVNQMKEKSPSSTVEGCKHHKQITHCKVCKKEIKPAMTYQFARGYDKGLLKGNNLKDMALLSQKEAYVKIGDKLINPQKTTYNLIYNHAIEDFIEQIKKE